MRLGLALDWNAFVISGFVDERKNACLNTNGMKGMSDKYSLLLDRQKISSLSTNPGNVEKRLFENAEDKIARQINLFDW